MDIFTYKACAKLLQPYWMASAGPQPSYWQRWLERKVSSVVSKQYFLFLSFFKHVYVL